MTLATACAPLGDRALTITLGDDVSESTFWRVQNAWDAVRNANLPGIEDCVPAYGTLTVCYDPGIWTFAKLRGVVAPLAASATTIPPTCKSVKVIPVCYGGEFGVDLDWIAQQHALTSNDVIALHQTPTYLVHLVGFLPGFPYLGGLPPLLATPRRPTPRRKVLAGSVGIADRQTGIYPFETPGGWQLIGRTPLPVFDPLRQPPTLLQPGDRVRFQAITPDEFHEQNRGGRTP